MWLPKYSQGQAYVLAIANKILDTLVYSKKTLVAGRGAGGGVMLNILYY